MKDSFDSVIEQKIGKITIKYGVIYGEDKVLLIKTGLGGSIYGYKNKYLTIANRVKDKYGYTVIVSDNPYDKSLGVYFGFNKDYLKYAIEAIKGMGLSEPIYLFAHSNGALMSLQHAYKYPEIKKALLINVPLYIFNTGTVNKCVEKYEASRLTLVYGSEDDSKKYFDRLKVEPVIIDGEDHHFTKENIYDFKNLPEEYLLT